MTTCAFHKTKQQRLTTELKLKFNINKLEEIKAIDILHKKAEVSYRIAIADVK